MSRIFIPLAKILLLFLSQCHIYTLKHREKIKKTRFFSFIVTSKYRMKDKGYLPNPKQWGVMNIHRYN